MIRPGELMGIVIQDGIAYIHVKDKRDGSFISSPVDDPRWLSDVMDKISTKEHKTTPDKGD